MAWSKLKKQFESLLAPSLRGRLRVHVTEYTHKSPMDVGRGWFTWDGTEVVSVQIPSFYSNNFVFRPETMDFGKAIHAYLSMPVSEARTSADELLAGFALLDRRTGKRALREVAAEGLHPFSRVLYGIRCKAEGLDG